MEQQLEEANSRLPLSDALAASAAAEREQALEHVRREAAAGIEEAQRQAETLREKAASLERELTDVRRRLSEAQSAFVSERESLGARVAALEQAVEFHEKQAAEAIVTAVPEALRGRVYVSAQASVQRSAALLRQCRYCVGNDTGVLNMAVANEVPALGLFGVTPPMAADPLLHALVGDGMASISVAAVLARLGELGAPVEPDGSGR
jgi:heptosyltransferase-2